MTEGDEVRWLHLTAYSRVSIIRSGLKTSKTRFCNIPVERDTPLQNKKNQKLHN